MELFEAITERHSTKRFTGQTLQYNTLTAIARAGCHAPTIGDLRETEFIVTNDGRKIDQVSNHSHGQTWIRNAGGIIAVASNKDRIAKYYDEEATHLGDQHGAAAMQNLLLAAHALNVGACWVSRYDEEAIRTVFSPPQKSKFEKGGKEIIGLIVLGIPAHKPPSKPRIQPRNRVFFEATGERLRDKHALQGVYYKHLQKTGYNAYKAARSATSGLSTLFKPLLAPFQKDEPNE